MWPLIMFVALFAAVMIAEIDNQETLGAKMTITPAMLKWVENYERVNK